MDSLFLLQFACFIFMFINAFIVALSCLHVRWKNKRYERSRWMIAAAITGLAHANVAQFVNALLLGLLLGWMYYRTKSLVPGILLHWVNNTMAYVLSNIMPQSDGKLIDLFHGDEKTMYYAVAFSLCIMIPSFIQLVIRLKKVKA